MAPAAERVFPGAPTSIGGGRVIYAPFQFLVSGEDNLRIEGWNTVTGAALVVAYRFARRAGTIQAEEHRVPLTADRIVTERDVALGDGYLLNLSVFVTGAAPRIGQTFVCIKLIRGLSGATMVLGLLLQGYVTAEQGLGWPGSPIEDSISGGGVIRYITGTDPAAGAQASEVVPTGARWQLLAWTIELATNAVVATRRIGLSVDDGTITIVASMQAGSQAASLTQSWRWACGMALETALGGEIFVAGWPMDLPILAGHNLATFTRELQAGDNFGAPSFYVREWLEVDA